MKTDQGSRVEKLNDFLYLMRFELFEANCLLLMTSRYAFVIDTYMGPDSMKEFRHILDIQKGTRKLFVINTHSHFDHIWGNCAFPEASFIAHESCRDIMRRESHAVLEGTKRENPGWLMGNVDLIFPDITFTEKMSFIDDTMTIELQHMPGHSRDSIVAIVSPHLCLAGDAIEDPFPLLSESGDQANIDIFIEHLERLSSGGFSLVIPGHGHSFKASLVSENLAYLNNLKACVLDLLKAGLDPTPANVPVSACLGRSLELTEFYGKAHSENIDRTASYMRRIMK
jgi:cyclase